MLTRDQAIGAYRRAKEVGQVRYARLRKMVAPVGCGCRIHNTIINYESGFNEGPQHHQHYKLAKRFLYLERRHYDEIHRLIEHFARFF